MFTCFIFSEFFTQLLCFTQSQRSSWFTWALELALQAGKPCGRRMRLVRHADTVIPRWQLEVSTNGFESAESEIIYNYKKICEFIAIKDFGIIGGNLLNLLNIKKMMKKRIYSQKKKETSMRRRNIETTCFDLSLSIENM